MQKPSWKSFGEIATQGKKVRRIMPSTKLIRQCATITWDAIYDGKDTFFISRALVACWFSDRRESSSRKLADLARGQSRTA